MDNEEEEEEQKEEQKEEQEYEEELEERRSRSRRGSTIRISSKRRRRQKTSEPSPEVRSPTRFTVMRCFPTMALADGPGGSFQTA